MGIREVQERVSESIEKVPGRCVDGTVKASRVAERGRQRAIGNGVVVCVRVYVYVYVCEVCVVCVHARVSVCARVHFGFVYQCVRVCVWCVYVWCVCVCVRVHVCDVLCMCIQFVAPPCTDQKRGPKSRLLLNLIPGHDFTMFSTSLYDDIRTQEASQKRI